MREKALRCFSGWLEVESRLNLLYWSLSHRSWPLELLLNWGSGNKLLGGLVGSIKWVDKWVDTSTVGTVGDKRGTGSIELALGTKVGTICVELEVAVGWVMRVDEGICVGVYWGINIIVIVKRYSSLGDKSSLLDRSSLLDGSNLLNRSSLLNRS